MTDTTNEGVVVTVVPNEEGGFGFAEAQDVVNSASNWATENPRAAVAVGGVAAVATVVVAYQIGKKIFS